MQTNRKVYSYSGLIAVLGLVALLVGFIVTVLLPGIRLAAWGILALGIILLATAFIIDFRRVSSAIAGQRGRFSTGTTVMTSIFIGIVILVNAISIGNYLRFDATGLAQFTLTSQTKDVLGKLKTPVQAITFFVPNDPYGISSYASSLLTEYQNYTDQLTVESIDPDEHPDQAREYGISQYQTIVFESGNHRRSVLPQEIVGQAEHAFTSAILEVTGTVQKKLYFLTGHGESNINSDYSYAKEGLQDNLYQVDTLDLLITHQIPDDCAALIIAAPKKLLIDEEVKIIEDYLKNDGWVMILTNPNPSEQIEQFLIPWEVTIENGTVIDPSSYAAPSKDSPSVPRIRNFFGLSVSYFPGTTAIIPIEKDEGKEKKESNIEMVPLVWSSKDSWLETAFDPAKEPALDEGVDVKGPLAIGVLLATVPPEQAENAPPPEETRTTRLIVFGDSDFASNQHFYNGNNGDLFLNAVNLLTVGKELITIERKVLPFRRLVIGPEETNLIRYSSIALIPLLVLIAGGIIWWRRR
ncbi:GldG family protein [Chloroflexota bacterium]